MLNILKNITTLNNYKVTANNNIKHNTIKNFPSSTREWDNSIYTFNKNYLNVLPETRNIVIRLIKSYFNLYNINIENNLRKSNIRKRFKRLSSNKIYVSNGVFKHTNDKVIIVLHIYNRQRINYIYFFKRKFKKLLERKITQRLSALKYNMEKYIEEMEKRKSIIIETIENKNSKMLFNNYYNLCLNNHKLKIYYKILKKYRKYFLYKQLLFINKSKFNYNYLTYLSHLLKRVYNKDIQFNIVNLKYFYLNSDIFTESILLKIRRNRRKLIRKLKYLIIKSKINQISKFITYKPMSLNKLNVKTKDPINYIILNKAYRRKKSLKRTALSIIKYKRVTGVRLEAKGRLTKRYTASRSVSKLRYKGNIINIDSSYLGLSSVFLKGNLRPNIQYTKLKSKTRIGSFGLKGWISGY